MSVRVLLVENQTNSRMTLAYQIRMFGYEVVETTRGEEAIQLLKTQVFNLVITDIVMNVIDGIAILKDAHRQPYHPAVILLTENASLNTAIDAVNHGAVGYLLKPCPTDTLLGYIEKAIAIQHAKQKLLEATSLILGTELLSEDFTFQKVLLKPSKQYQPLVVGHISIGETRQKVSFKGNPIKLTPIEYELLYYLALQPDVPHTYEDIVKVTHHVLLARHEAQTLIRPHVRSLRRKIHPDVIGTVRGEGYILVSHCCE